MPQNAHSSIAVGPFVVSGLYSPCFVFVFLVNDAVAAAGRLEVLSGDSERFPPPSPPVVLSVGREPALSEDIQLGRLSFFQVVV